MEGGLDSMAGEITIIFSFPNQSTDSNQDEDTVLLFILEKIAIVENKNDWEASNDHDPPDHVCNKGIPDDFCAMRKKH